MASEVMNLWQKMAHVSKNVGAVKKDGYNKHNKYNYQSIEAVTDSLRELMADTGLAMFSECVSVVLDNQNWLCEYVFTFVDVDTGASKECKWHAAVPANNDKALGAAHSYAQKYFLMRTFLISSNEDLDENSDNGSKSSGYSKKAPPKMSKTMPDSSAGSPPPPTIPYEQLDNRRKKVFEAVKPHFDENFGTYMKFCGEHSVDWNMKSDEIIQHIRKAIQ